MVIVVVGVLVVVVVVDAFVVVPVVIVKSLTKCKTDEWRKSFKIQTSGRRKDTNWHL